MKKLFSISVVIVIFASIFAPFANARQEIKNLFVNPSFEQIGRAHV